MTTIPLPPDLEVALTARAAAEGVPLEELIGDALREVAGSTSFATPELEEAWMEEIARREDRLERGQTQAIPWDQAMQHLRQRVRSARAA